MADDDKRLSQLDPLAIDATSKVYAIDDTVPEAVTMGKTTTAAVVVAGLGDNQIAPTLDDATDESLIKKSVADELILESIPEITALTSRKVLKNIYIPSDVYGNSNDGDLTVSSDLELDVSTHLKASHVAGTLLLEVGDSSKVIDGDEVVIIKTQIAVEPDNANLGYKEYNRVSQVVDGTHVLLMYPLQTTFHSTDVGATIGATKSQMTKVMNYGTLNVQSGFTLTPTLWNQKSGGQLFIRAQILLGSGTISATNRGFARGYATTTPSSAGHYYGEGFTGFQSAQLEVGGGGYDGCGGGHLVAAPDSLQGPGGTAYGLTEEQSASNPAFGAGGGVSTFSQSAEVSVGGGIVYVFADDVSTWSGDFEADSIRPATSSDTSGGGAGGTLVLLTDDTITPTFSVVGGVNNINGQGAGAVGRTLVAVPSETPGRVTLWANFVAETLVEAEADSTSLVTKFAIDAIINEALAGGTITQDERDKLAAITDTGSGIIISDAERLLVDTIVASGAITQNERNKLALITDLGSGIITSDAERILWNSAASSGTAVQATGHTQVFVATTGNDTTGDGTSGLPYLTIARAWEDIRDVLFVETAQATIKLGAGSFSIGTGMSVNHVTGGKIGIVGDTIATTTVTSTDDGFIIDNGFAFGRLDAFTLSGVTAAGSIGLKLENQASMCAGPFNFTSTSIDIENFAFGVSVQYQSRLGVSQLNIDNCSNAVNIGNQSQATCTSGITVTNCSGGVTVLGNSTLSASTVNVNVTGAALTVSDESRCNVTTLSTVSTTTASCIYISYGSSLTVRTTCGSTAASGTAIAAQFGSTAWLPTSTTLSGVTAANPATSTSPTAVYGNSASLIWEN